MTVCFGSTRSQVRILSPRLDYIKDSSESRIALNPSACRNTCSVFSSAKGLGSKTKGFTRRYSALLYAIQFFCLTSRSQLANRPRGNFFILLVIPTQDREQESKTSRPYSTPNIERTRTRWDFITAKYWWMDLGPVSYTHLRAPRDLSTSRMPSSA